MSSYADLEIGLHRRDGYDWSVELRFSQPATDGDVLLVPDATLIASFDFEALRALGDDDVAYGRALSQGLMASHGVDQAFAEARATAAAQGLALRVRLFIGPSAPELHALRWETLRDLEDNSPLLTNENILFSRYLSSLDWRPVGVRPKTDLRALVVVAAPADASTYEPSGRPLALVDRPGERERALAGLANLSVTELTATGAATPANLFAALRDGHDILYLVCHGYLARGEPVLLLEDASGNAQRVTGTEFIDRVRELQRPPRLVVLASCQSAGSGEGHRSDDSGAVAALGPRMAEVGVPAVVAMQGNVSMATMAEFMPTFFRELQRDGQIDRAVAVARGTVRHRPDWWVPTLFMRLKSGRIWYSPGFATDRPGFDKWPALFSDIGQKLCTPVLGPGLTDAMLGSRQEIAQRWASTFHFPMAAHYRDDLPQVAQFLSINLNHRFPRVQLAEYLRDELFERFGDYLSDDLRKGTLDEILTGVWNVYRQANPSEPYSVLAQLPFPQFINTHPSNLLADALTAAGKQPQVELCKWAGDDVEWPPSVYDTDPNYRPEPARPLVYQLFGLLSEPDSLVLTEDNYFDFLIGVTREKDLIPSPVRRAFASTALLFLGFRLDEWDFRVLFRSIMNQEGRRKAKDYTHVAVQIDPEEGRTLEPERAKRYLESYFGESDISIYWGSTDDFVRELGEGWKAHTR